jgi:thiazole synthase
MRLTINGELRDMTAGTATVAELLSVLELDARKIAIELNREIVPRSAYAATGLNDGDKLEIVHFIGGGNAPLAGDDYFEVAGKRFRSRLLVGTGKYKDFEQTKLAIEASGAEIVTVAVRRVNVTDRNQPMLVDYVDPKKYTYLPNTAGCFTADDAVRTLRLAREAGGWKLVKLEVLGDQKTLYPDMEATLAATKLLVKEGFDVMVYCADDPIAARKLEDLGACAIMPLAAPIGSGLGLRRRADEHRDRRSERPDPHGARHEAGHRGRPPGLPGRPHAEETLRRSLLAARRPHLMPGAAS